MILHVCRYAVYVSVSLGPGRRWNGWTNEVFTTVRYGTVLPPLGGEGMLVCMRTCVRARVHVCWAGLGGAVRCGAVRCCAGLGGAVLVRCGAGFIVGV